MRGSENVGSTALDRRPVLSPRPAASRPEPPARRLIASDPCLMFPETGDELRYRSPCFSDATPRATAHEHRSSLPEACISMA